MSKRTQATTEAAIKHAKPEEKPYKMTAGLGMYLLVNPIGSKLWRLKYRFEGKEKTLSIGAYPDVTLAQARLKREQARQQLAVGIDPNELIKQQRQQAKAEALTFKTVAERWYKGRTVLAQKKWAPATASKARLYLEKDLYPAFGDRVIADITRMELISFNEQIEKRGAFDVAGKLRQWLNIIFDDAYDSGEIPHNPAKDLKPSRYAIGGIASRHHPTVSFSELPELLESLDATGSHKLIKLAIRMLMLTAVRPAELRFAKWSEFKLNDGMWTIPSERMKTRLGHSVPITRQVLEILKKIKAINPNGYLFTVRGDKPISENTINKALKLAGYGGKQTGHGFRHLLSTELNERSYNRDWIEKQLAHNSKNDSTEKIRRIYNHAEYIVQRQQMMQEWADSIDAACSRSYLSNNKRKL